MIVLLLQDGTNNLDGIFGDVWCVVFLYSYFGYLVVGCYSYSSSQQLWNISARTNKMRQKRYQSVYYLDWASRVSLHIWFGCGWTSDTSNKFFVRLTLFFFSFSCCISFWHFIQNRRVYLKLLGCQWLRIVWKDIIAACLHMDR